VDSRTGIPVPGKAVAGMVTVVLPPRGVFPAGGPVGSPAGRGGEPASGVVSSYRTS
jgi:hypothetical protein